MNSRIWYDTSLLDIQVPRNWENAFSRCQDAISIISEELKVCSKRKAIFPSPDNVYKALELVSPEEVKCVILGMDPYFNPGLATGLAFSVKKDVPIPSSLHNIVSELRNDGFSFDPEKAEYDDILEKWARQGVLLLNTSLTVPEREQGKHIPIWRPVIDEILLEIDPNPHMVIILWGNDAQRFRNHFSSWHDILTSSHPSGQSAHISFLGSSPFRKANELLKAKGQKEVDWSI